jgi:predicted CoA-binding protein
MDAVPSDTLRAIFKDTHTVAVLGAHIRPEKPSHYVPAYLQAQGFEVVAVNPVFAGQDLFGTQVLARLTECPFPVDLVNVFRRAEALPSHVDEILAMQPRPKVVWFQLGIRHPEIAARLEEEGITVIQDRCTLADHRGLQLLPKRR